MKKILLFVVLMVTLSFGVSQGTFRIGPGGDYPTLSVFNAALTDLTGDVTVNYIGSGFRDSTIKNNKFTQNLNGHNYTENRSGGAIGSRTCKVWCVRDTGYAWYYFTNGIGFPKIEIYNGFIQVKDSSFKTPNTIGSTGFSCVVDRFACEQAEIRYHHNMATGNDKNKGQMLVIASAGPPFSCRDYEYRNVAAGFHESPLCQFDNFDNHDSVHSENNTIYDCLCGNDNEYLQQHYTNDAVEKTSNVVGGGIFANLKNCSIDTMRLAAGALVIDTNCLVGIPSGQFVNTVLDSPNAFIPKPNSALHGYGIKPLISWDTLDFLPRPWPKPNARLLIFPRENQRSSVILWNIAA